MLPVDRWTVFYADESTFTSEQGTWAEAPPFGVSMVVYYLVGGRCTVDLKGSDVAIYTYLGTTAGSDEQYKMGLWTDGEQFWRVHDLAMRTTTP